MHIDGDELLHSKLFHEKGIDPHIIKIVSSFRQIRQAVHNVNSSNMKHRNPSFCNTINHSFTHPISMRSIPASLTCTRFLLWDLYACVGSWVAPRPNPFPPPPFKLLLIEKKELSLYTSNNCPLWSLSYSEKYLHKVSYEKSSQSYFFTKASTNCWVWGVSKQFPLIGGNVAAVIYVGKPNYGWSQYSIINVT